MLFGAIATSGIDSGSKHTKSNNDKQQSLSSNYRNYLNFQPGRQNNRSERADFVRPITPRWKKRKGEEMSKKKRLSVQLHCSVLLKEAARFSTSATGEALTSE